MSGFYHWLLTPGTYITVLAIFVTIAIWPEDEE